jgi:hypothetical protein
VEEAKPVKEHGAESGGKKWIGGRREERMVAVRLIQKIRRIGR